MRRITCPYCNKEPEWVENSVVYGRRYGRSYMCYYCKSCDSYVGCHQNTRSPLGTMANKELREWRKRAHAVFDPLWKGGKKSRGSAYELLSNIMKKNEVHIGQSTVEECKQIIEAISPLSL